MTTLARSDPPLTAALLPLHRALAWDMRKSALIVFPATVRLRSATEASDRLAFPWPTVLAWATSAPFSAPTLPSEMGATSRTEACCAPPSGGRGPVSATVIGARGGTVACTTYACPLKPDVEDECAKLTACSVNTPKRSVNCDQA